MSYDERIQFTEAAFIKFQKENENQRDCSNKNKPWTDEELTIILLDAPTKANCIKYAKIFKRGYGSIEQIYRWAATTDKDIKESRPNDSFISQIKKIAKEIGFRA